LTTHDKSSIKSGDRPTPQADSRAQSSEAISGNEECKPKITPEMIAAAAKVIENWADTPWGVEWVAEDALRAAMEAAPKSA